MRTHKAFLFVAHHKLMRLGRRLVVLVTKVSKVVCLPLLYSQNEAALAAAYICKPEARAYFAVMDPGPDLCPYRKMHGHPEIAARSLTRPGARFPG